MARDTGNLKWILGGSILFLLVVAGLCYLCYLWYQYSLAPYRQQAAETAEQIRQWKQSKEARDTDKATEQVGTTQTVGSVENMSVSTDDTTEKTDILVENKDTDPTEDAVSKATVTDTPISRFGFGPYPKVPEGLSIPPWEAHTSPNYELMTRVRIKLWEEGIQSDGATMENGLVYPTVRGRVYIQTDDKKYTDGSKVQYGRIKSHPGDNIRLIRGKLPDLSGFDVYTFDDGIEPYSYLNLEKEKK